MQTVDKIAFLSIALVFFLLFLVILAMYNSTFKGIVPFLDYLFLFIMIMILFSFFISMVVLLLEAMTLSKTLA